MIARVLAAVFIGIPAFLGTAQAELKTGPSPLAPFCRIGSGTVAVPSGNQSGHDLRTPVSKRAGEMLSGAYAPTNLSFVQASYASPEVLESFRKKLTEYNEQMRSDALRSLEIMLDQARRSGVELFVHSAYRDYKTQCGVFNHKLGIERQGHKEMNETQAITSVNKRSAFPGQSEHQLGTVVDLVTNIPGLGYKLEPQLDSTPAYAWLQQNAHEFGFVLSYPRGVQALAEPHPQTGYIYEPWHWRYIGEVDAQNYKRCLKRMSMVLQDYLRVLKQDPKFYCR